jgi:hypothetical protein
MREMLRHLHSCPVSSARAASSISPSTGRLFFLALIEGLVVDDVNNLTESDATKMALVGKDLGLRHHGRVRLADARTCSTALFVAAARNGLEKAGCHVAGPVARTASEKARK